MSCTANSQTRFLFLISSHTYFLIHSSRLFVKVMRQEFRSLKRELHAPSSVKFILTVTASINLFETKQLSRKKPFSSLNSTFCCYSTLAFTHPNRNIRSKFLFESPLFFFWWTQSASFLSASPLLLFHSLSSAFWHRRLPGRKKDLVH